MNKIIWTMSVIIILSANSHSIDYNEYIFLHNSKRCNNYFHYVEEKNNIPKNLLKSMSIIETGRWHKEAKVFFTWPWTVNQAGNSYYFSTKAEAIEAVKKMLKLGYTNIDIGCMQINLHHHPEAFLNLEEAFDPKTNIEYAANFLLKNYQVHNNWNKAVAYYHSQNSIGTEYANKVIKVHSDFNHNELFDFCTSATGNLTSCNNLFNYNTDNLPTSYVSDNTKKIALYGNAKPNKNVKRLKSNIILYSINN